MGRGTQTRLFGSSNLSASYHDYPPAHSHPDHHRRIFGLYLERRLGGLDVVFLLFGEPKINYETNTTQTHKRVANASKYRRVGIMGGEAWLCEKKLFLYETYSKN